MRVLLLRIEAACVRAFRLSVHRASELASIRQRLRRSRRAAISPLLIARKIVLRDTPANPAAALVESVGSLAKESAATVDPPEVQWFVVNICEIVVVVMSALLLFVLAVANARFEPACDSPHGWHVIVDERRAGS